MIFSMETVCTHSTGMIILVTVYYKIIGTDTDYKFYLDDKSIEEAVGLLEAVNEVFIRESQV